MNKQPMLHIILNGDQCWPELSLPGTTTIDAGNEIYLAGLDHGMESGKTSVTLRIDLPDGRTVLAQTSLSLLNIAVKALNARYPAG